MPLLEQSAKKKKQPLEKVLKQIEGVLTSMLNSPTATEALKKKVAILLELLNKDLAKTSQALGTTTINLTEDIIGFQKCITNDEIFGEIEWEFSSDVYTGKKIVDIYKTDIAHTSFMQEMLGKISKSNWENVWSWFNTFVHTYEGMGRKRENALLQTETDFRIFQQFVKPGDVHATLKGWPLLRWIYDIRHSNKLPEGWSDQDATSARFQRKAVCAGLARLAKLLFSLAGYADNFHYDGSYIENHAVLRIENLSTLRPYYDPTAADFDDIEVWRHVNEGIDWQKELNLTSPLSQHNFYDHNDWFEARELKVKNDAKEYGIDLDRIEEYRAEYSRQKEENYKKKIIPFFLEDLRENVARRGRNPQ